LRVRPAHCPYQLPCFSKVRPVPRGRRLPALFGSSSDLRSDGIDPLYAGPAPGDPVGAETDGLVRATCTNTLNAHSRFWIEACRPPHSRGYHGPRVGRRSSARRAASRAAAQLPNTEVTTLAGGHTPASRRRSASPPRRRACVRDQSYDDGSRRYRSSRSPIASSTRSRVQRRWIAPGWQALQYA
jgi:hypothetical protein